MNSLGKKMVEEYFPDHHYAIVTHTDTDKTHNHIVINPVSNTEKSRRITNEKKHLYRLREINDKLARENGLSVVKSQSRESWDKMSDEVRSIYKRTGFSRTNDLMEKARFSMSIATSFDEYSAYLNRGFGIKFRIRGKTVSYLYPGLSKWRRAGKLSVKYDFDGLQKRFEENDKALVRQGLKKATDIEGKDYSKYYRFKREETEYKIPDYRIKGSIIPIEKLDNLKNSSVESYCDRMGIELKENADGEKSLSGRDYIRVSKNSWKNLRTGCEGGLLEFKAYFNNKSFLDSIGEDLERDFVDKMKMSLDVPEPSFQAFYVPTNDKRIREKELINHLVITDGFNRSLLFELSKSGRFRVFEKNRFKVYSDSENVRSLTFYRDPNSKWFTKKIKGLDQNLINLRGQSNELILFSSVESFLKSNEIGQFFNRKSIPQNLVVPMKPIRNWINENEDFLSSFERVRFVKDDSKNVFDDILSFRDPLKKTEAKNMSVEELDKFIKKSFKKRERN